MEILRKTINIEDFFEMKAKTVLLIIFLVISGTALVYTSFYSDHSSHHPIWEPETKPKQVRDLPKENSPALRTSEESGGIEKYILKYNPEQNKVELVTCYLNGNKIISTVDSINPTYLEEDDIRMLTEGIEMSDKTSMHILIEDYSS